MHPSIPFRESPCITDPVTIDGMDAKSNRTAWMRVLVADAGGPAAWVAAYGAGTKWTPAQVSQWTSMDRPKGIGHALARSLEKAQGLAPAIMDGPIQDQSQRALLDIDRLGVALTAIDKALRDVEIQGRLGTLAEAVQWAYGRAFTLRDVADQAQRELFDELVAMHLGSWDGRTGVVETGAGEDRTVAATRPQARSGGRARRH